MKTNFTYLLLLLMLGAATTLSAQTNGKLALDYLQKEYAAFGLEASDIDDLRLAYRVVIDRHASDADIWYVVIDAENGDVLEQANQVLKCSFGTPNHQHNYDNACANVTPKALPVSEQMFESAVAEESSYNVYRFGVESPIHGERTLEKSPAHPVASPFGWHDTNGQDGPEFTITRGNNAWSYPDTDGDNVAETNIVAEGGDSLVFDFFFEDEVAGDNIDTILPAAMAQTFYLTNVLHDWLYLAGFDEAAGNFQSNNYTGEGADGDEVFVEVQDGSGTNNATFSTPADGSSGRMQMFLWVANASRMRITAPAGIAGPFTTGTADFGPVIGSEPVTGQVAISDPAVGCTEITNDLTGKIALITRGECNFSLKVFNAQEAGAVGVIICNDAMAGEDRGGLVNMTNGNPELTITIPSVFLTFEDCVNLRNTVAAGDSVSVTLQFSPPPPRDGDFDNGIVAHELGHGVSHRLIGVWATMLWDLYWAMTDEYGFDEDLLDGTGGNNQAFQLVVEGLKRTKCRPGFVDGRDGILAADMDINNGANQCLIWEVFARRGVGFSARQGDADDRTDGREAFDLSPACLGGVFLTKTVDENTINAGEGVTYSLAVTSFRAENTENIVITDVVPEGMTIDEGSIRGADDFTIDGQTITFNVGTLGFEGEEIIRYSVSSDPNIGSTQTYFDGAEDGDDDWFPISLNTDPDILELFWEQTDTTPYLGDLAYYVVNTSNAQDQVLRSAEAFSVAGEQPVMRFFTKYETEAGWDAGLIEVSTDGTTWQRVEDKLVRGNYRGEVSPDGTEALLNTDSFWGNSEDEPDATSSAYREIIVDLGDFIGQDIFVRYRFISDAAVGARGWWVDDIEMLDAKNYESTT